MKSLINIIILVMSFSGVVNAADISNVLVKGRGSIDIYSAIESSSLRISIGSDLKGFVEGKVCDHCDEIKVIITPQTKAYENNTEVPLRNAKSRIGRYATVMFEIESKKAIAIRW